MRRSDTRRRVLLVSVLVVTGLVLGLMLARPHLRGRAVLAGQLSATLQQELRQAAAMDGASGGPGRATASGTDQGRPGATSAAVATPDQSQATQSAPEPADGLFRMSPYTAKRLISWAIPGMSRWAKPTDTMIVYHDGQRQGGLFQHFLPFLGSTALWGTASPSPQPTTPAPVAPGPTTDPTGNNGGGTTSVPNPPGTSTPSGPVKTASKEPVVGIYHSHDYESYISEFPGKTFKPEEEYLIMSNDPEHDILKVGQRLAQSLSKSGVTTVWSGARHQENGYLGAYTESRKTAQAMIKQYPSIKLLYDVHRDSGPPKIVTINGQQVAKVDIILGLGQESLTQPHVAKNRAYAQQIKVAMEQMYPGLFDRILERPNNTYNQDLRDGAILFEIGSASNTMEEALRGADLLANVIARLVQDGQYPH